MNQQSNTSSLVRRVKKNDAVAMRALYDQYAKEMLGTSLRITNDKHQSEDILQECFLNSFHKIDQLEDENRYGHWLKRIIVNKSLTAVKKRIRYQELDVLSNQAEEVDDHWYLGISFKEISQAIQNLPDGCRQVFALYLLDNYKHQEVAEMLEISVSTSKSQYQYALKILRKQLKEEDD